MVKSNQDCYGKIKKFIKIEQKSEISSKAPVGAVKSLKTEKTEKNG